ncbi:hypothetical protein J8J27_33575, partial [Mycobacterium tuberculosis]|nr:hypothetical protein [Mycobacterium tuberculosis]
MAAVLDTARIADQIAGLPGMSRRPDVLMRGVGFVAALRAGGIPVKTGVRLEAFAGGGDGVTGVSYRLGGRSTT